MKAEAHSFLSVILSILICLLLYRPSITAASDLDKQIMELKIKAITSVELSAMSFDELPSLFFLYENLVNKRFESVHKQDRRHFEEFKKVHQYYAIKSSFYSLKLSDVLLHEDFNAENLEIIANKVDWSERKVTKYGFLAKDKNGKFKFHDKVFADFFIADYFLDNIVHPTGSPSDDEMELRLRLFFYITANLIDRYPVANELIMDMIEDQKGEIFSDQVRMLMKYKFKSVLDPFFVQYLDYVEKMSKIFGKDSEILGNLWGIDENLPFFLRYFGRRRFSSSVKELKAIADQYFTAEADPRADPRADQKLTSNSTRLPAENIFRGKNQILTVLSRIHEKKSDNFTKDILDVTKYQVSDQILTKLSQTEDFLDFVDSSNFSLTDKKQFYMSNAYSLISSTWHADKLTQLCHRMEKYFTKNEMKLILTQKDQHFNHTHLFHLPSRFDFSYAETFLNLTRTFMNPQEIKEFLSQRRPMCQDSFLTHYLKIAENATVYEFNFNFAKEFLTHEELKSLIFDNNDISFIQKVAGKEEMLKLGIKILSEFYTKEEIQDMLMATDDRKRNIIFWVVDALTNDARPDVADILRDYFKGQEDKLKQMFKIKDNNDENVFVKFNDSFYAKKFQPFLYLAKEIFTDKELKKLSKN